MQIRLFPFRTGLCCGGKEVPLSEVHTSRSRNSPLEDDGKDGNGSNYQEGQTPKRRAHDQWQPVLHHLRALPWQGRHIHTCTRMQRTGTVQSFPSAHWDLTHNSIPTSPLLPSHSLCFSSAFFPTPEEPVLPLNPLSSLPRVHWQLTSHLSTG